ncbi:hypothetical protein BU14_0148s0012 [Porphyra umbilicalis]|uniref:Uncharacterized protein n=1 Tax=Porphyra umbilicalis TaxID=2786 RepID=A0A1X6P9L3_PORUM|nr:hypothetical protein BU14_0148s0012 [Porphyra umbilicalis]|eukprot:OSX77436.1 hypothetical protein BU14_0148s0012 [Porphyra umbilicalis]
MPRLTTYAAVPLRSPTPSPPPSPPPSLPLSLPPSPPLVRPVGARPRDPPAGVTDAHGQAGGGHDKRGSSVGGGGGSGGATAAAAAASSAAATVPPMRQRGRREEPASFLPLPPTPTSSVVPSGTGASSSESAPSDAVAPLVGAAATLSAAARRSDAIDTLGTPAATMAAGATAKDGEYARQVVADDSGVAAAAVQGDEPGSSPTGDARLGGGHSPPAGGGGGSDGGGPLPATVVSDGMRSPPPVFPSPSNDIVRHLVRSSSLVHDAPAFGPPTHGAPPAAGIVTDTRVTPAPWPAPPFGIVATGGGGGGGGGGSSGGDSGGRGSGPAASVDQGNSEDDHNTIQLLTSERDGLLRANGSLAHRNARARADAADAAATAAATQAAAAAHVADLQRSLALAQASRARDADVAHAVADELDRFRLLLETDSVRLINEQEAHRQRLCVRLGAAAGPPRNVRRIDTSRGVDVALAAVCGELEARMWQLEATVNQRVAVVEAMSAHGDWGDGEGRRPPAPDGGGGGGDGRGGGPNGRDHAAAESRRVASWPLSPPLGALGATEGATRARRHDNGAAVGAALTYPSAAATRAGGRWRDGGRAGGGGPPSPPSLPHRETAVERRPDWAPLLPMMPLLPALPAEGPLVPGGSSSTGTPPAPADTAEAAVAATDDSAADARAA